MSRWGKNIVVPLDSLYKEKDSTNRPNVTRSVGTVGKWGKMGFTSTRTYALSALAAAAAVAASPAQSPASAIDDDMSPSVPEPPKPKKFFKSRNTTPPEVFAQIIQQLPRAPTSPIRDSNYTAVTPLSTPVQRRDSIKLKIPKSSSAERKKKTPKKLPKKPADEENTDTSTTPVKVATVEPKAKKKKDEKKLKPEAPPSRVTSRARKAVNYCEVDDDDRIATPIKDIILPRGKLEKVESTLVTPPVTPIAAAIVPATEQVLPPPTAPPPSVGGVPGTAPNVASKTPEHPPIVLRISKGTSRLVSTDSEEQQANTSPLQGDIESTTTKSRHSSTDEVPAAPQLSATPKIIVKPPKPPSPDPPHDSPTNDNEEESPEINYCTVKISPDKPPKERLKLIIKTNVIRNAIAAAAAEKAALAESTAADADGTRPEKEKKQKGKKHKHLKHATIEQLTPATATLPGSEFKTPSPHLALGTNAEQQQSAVARTVLSPAAMSERDFDSQSSVLGSISSKGNSTPQLLAQTVQEENCVVHSRGSSVITSDLETSQHSSLVAPPSDIESRLESMMMDGDGSQRAPNLVEEEPLQEDILAILRGEGDESQTNTETAAEAAVKVNGTLENEKSPVKDDTDDTSKRRVTRGRGRLANKTSATEILEKEKSPPKTPTATRTRLRKTATNTVLPAEDGITTKRTNRRGVKKSEESSEVTTLMEVDEPPAKERSPIPADVSPSKTDPDKTSSQSAVSATTVRRGRSTRNAANSNLNNNNNNNNNINKIAANLSAKAGAAEEAKSARNTSPTSNTQPATRNYGRKRKNQQVTQVLQPSTESLEDPPTHPTPAKQLNLDLSGDLESCAIMPPSPIDSAHERDTPTSDLHDGNSNSNHVRAPSITPSSPPRRDYKIKDKFKRTLTLDNQVNCNTVEALSPNAALAADGGSSGHMGPVEEEQQRGSVKLVISKKKGSIFKSRALVPSEQSEQSAVNKRQHLYKHRWDAEANGDASCDAIPAKFNEKQTTRTVADGIYDDFTEEESKPALSRDNSPMIGKVTRSIKANPQAASNPYDLNAETIAPIDTTTTANTKIERKSKEYYTVVRNVKTAHQIQEIGEYQEMDDDVEYFVDALQPHNPTPTRCLSALQLASKCMTPAFRMHVRAHGVVTKFFKALSDANTDLSLGLCASAIMYILSQEGLNMDLDRDSLELMMNLLESESVAAPSDRANYERNRQKVRELCEEIKAQGKAMHLNVDSITVGTLAMETLLSLTSKRAGEWFKEELRTLGGLEHIIKTISDSCRPVIECSTSPNTINWTESLLDNMKTVERCMRVLENVTQMNEENQMYMLTYSNGAAINTICTLYCLCNRELMLHAPTTTTTTTATATANLKEVSDPAIVMRELLIPVMKVLINLTHTFNPAKAHGAELLGERNDILETSFQLLLQASHYIPDRCVFELSILVLLLLINLTMYTTPNRVKIMKATAPVEFGASAQQDKETKKDTAVHAVIEYFYKCEELARLVEKNTDAILDNTDKNKKKQEEVDETVNNLLQKAGHHMEHTLKGSYAGILIGHLITENEEYEMSIRAHLRGNGFKEIVSVLEKYYTFMNLTASSEASVVAHIKSTKKLIDYFKKRDLVHEMNESDNNALPLNLETHHDTPPDATSTTIASSTTSTTTTPSSTTTTRSGSQRVYKTYSQR